MKIENEKNNTINMHIARMSLYEIAMYYRNVHKWSVIPIKPASKQPAASWKEYQSRLATDEELERWFRDKTTEQIGIGLVTGKLSGVAVVDLDSYKDGFEAVDLNTPLISKTGGGGRHGFFAYQEGIKNRVNINGKSIDIRGEGGYVVLPPSIHPSGGVYEWE